MYVPNWAMSLLTSSRKPTLEGHEVYMYGGVVICTQEVCSDICIYVQDEKVQRRCSKPPLLPKDALLVARLTWPRPSQAFQLTRQKKKCNKRVPFVLERSKGAADLAKLDVAVDDGGGGVVGLNVGGDTAGGRAGTTSRTLGGGVNGVGGRVEPQHVGVVLEKNDKC